MSAVTPSVQLAIVGFGWWGRHIAQRLRGYETVTAIGVVETDCTRHDDISAMKLAIYDDLGSALADPSVDAVVLATPNPLHEAQVVAAAAAGKHVYCEKPLALKAAGARRAVQACNEAGVQLAVGHERRLEPAMIAVADAVERGDLGTIMHAEAAFSHDKLVDVPKGDWRTARTVAPAAGMTAMGIHLTDLFIAMFGSVETVQAMVSRRSLDWDTGDVVCAQLGFSTGVTASFSAVLHTPHFMRFHVFGSRQWIEVLNHSHPDTPGGRTTYRVSESGSKMREHDYAWTDTVVANLEAFARAVRGVEPYHIPQWQMVHNIEVLEAVTQSAETGQTIHMKAHDVAA